MSAPVTSCIPAAETRELRELLPDQIPGDTTHGSTDPGALVSVIVPCYNGAPFLEAALKSALEQSYAAVEVIVIDDGSTDSSPAIAQRFPVRYIRQQNRGLAEARNVGIRESRGAYIVFLDADDLLRPEAIEIGVRALKLRPECAMVVGDHVFIAADGSFLSHSTKFDPINSHYEALLKSNFIEMISSVLFRRRIFDEVGGFDAALSVSEDYELYLRISRVHSICCHPVVVAEYRRHSTNTSLNSEKMLTTTLRVLKDQERYLGDDPGRQEAFREGVRTWRKQYGRQLASELARSSSTLSMDSLQRKLRLLANHYPQGLLMLVLLRALPVLGQRNSSPYARPQPAATGDPLNSFHIRQAVNNLVVSQDDTMRRTVSAQSPSGTLSR